VSCQVERFQGTVGVHQTPRKPGRYAGHLTLSPGDPIPGSLCCVSAAQRSNARLAPYIAALRGESVRTRPSSLLFPYGRPLSRKENPPWDPHRRLLARLRCRSAMALASHMPQPLSWPRNINLVPFRWSVRRPPRERRGVFERPRSVFYAPHGPPDRTPLYGPYPIA